MVNYDSGTPDEENQPEDEEEQGPNSADPYPDEDELRRQFGEDDPDFDVLWDMTLEDLLKVSDNDQHPLHEKANRLLNLMLRPVADAIDRAAEKIVNPVVEDIQSQAMKSVRPKVDLSAYAPKIDVSAYITKPDLSGVLPRIDLSPFLPKFNYEPLMASVEAAARARRALDTVNDDEESAHEEVEHSELQEHESQSTEIEAPSESGNILVRDFQEGLSYYAKNIETNTAQSVEVQRLMLSEAIETNSIVKEIKTKTEATAQAVTGIRDDTKGSKGIALWAAIAASASVLIGLVALGWTILGPNNG